MYQTGNTISATLDAVHRHDLVLPAIQREFVWRPEQICRLFDSLMQGYPFGTFLYWRVDLRTALGSSFSISFGTITSVIVLIAHLCRRCHTIDSLLFLMASSD